MLDFCLLSVLWLFMDLVYSEFLFLLFCYIGLKGWFLLVPSCVPRCPSFISICSLFFHVPLSSPCVLHYVKLTLFPHSGLSSCFFVVTVIFLGLCCVYLPFLVSNHASHLFPFTFNYLMCISLCSLSCPDGSVFLWSAFPLFLLWIKLLLSKCFSFCLLLDYQQKGCVFDFESCHLYWACLSHCQIWFQKSKVEMSKSVNVDMSIF